MGLFRGLRENPKPNSFRSASDRAHNELRRVPPTGKGRRMRILLVEDHEDTRKAMSALLRITGHQVVDAGDGHAALAATDGAADGFDCAVIDLGLPDQDGIKLLGELRSRGIAKAIALTGSTGPDDVAACRAAGFTCHLSKPITIEELNAALGKL